jgi:signal transduction histidine kinase
LAQRAALAITNARLYEQAQQAAVLEERQRLARELHDAVTQTLFSATLIAEVLPRLWRRNQEEGQRRLEELRELTRGALAEMRTLLLELRPAALIEAKLGELLRHLTEAIIGRARTPVTLIVEGDYVLPPEVQVGLYRITQEALNNVAKHAKASQAVVSLSCQAQQVELHIKDDGRGFEPEQVRPEHLGLGIMRERAETIGAALRIQSQPGQGTHIEVVWPDPHRKEQL